jgi:hypothetical protein
MNEFFDAQTGGLSPLYGFIGQIAEDSVWINNHANTNFEHKLHLTNDIAGASRRAKVQILGKHVEVKNISDEQLPMAEVVLPTTGGSGHGGSHQTPNLKQGMYVWGFFKDGKQGTQPLIVGVLPNDPRVPLFKGNPSQNFVPSSGFVGEARSLPVSNSYIGLEGSTAEGGSVAPNQATADNSDQMRDGKRKFYNPTTINCEQGSGELEGIQKNLSAFLTEVKRAKRVSQQFLGAVSNLNSNINNLTNGFSNLITSLFKSLISKVRGFIVNELQKLLTRTYELIPPNLRSNLSKVNEGITNIIQCIFNKIISQLLATVKNLLEQAIEKYVNAPLCAVESFVASVISSFLGDLLSGVTDALSGIVGVAFDVAETLFKAFDILTGVLEFLSCDPDLDCQILDEWSFWDGSGLTTEQLGKKSKIASSLIGFANSREAFGGELIPGCSSSQIPCGPPKLVFLGQEKRPASGNLIVGLSGRIMGVDLLTGGRYASSPNGATPIDVKIVDDCGIGGGGIGIAITTNAGIGTTATDFDDSDVSVGEVIIIDSGSGYLSSSDGSTGGDGVLFSRPNETIIGTNVFPPGTSVGITSGQTIFLPPNTLVEVINEKQEVVDTIIGEGQTTPIIVTTPGTIVTPETTLPSETGTPPQEILPSYDVYVCLEDLAILSEGINYSPGDEIIITPDNGSKFEPILDQFGSITEVRIISKGCGFTDVPQIFVKSATGINANMVPIFSFDRINRDEETDFRGLPVVNVIDCVGVVKR